MSNGKHAPASGGPQDKAGIDAVQERISRRTRELRAFDVSGVQDRWDPRLELLQKKVNDVVADAVGRGSPQYKEYAIGPFDAGLDATFGERYTIDEFRDELRKGLAQASARLAQISKMLKERREGASGDSSHAPLRETAASDFAPLASSFAPLPSSFAPLPPAPAQARPAPKAAAPVAEAPPPVVTKAEAPAVVPRAEKPAPAPAPEAAPAPVPMPAPAPARASAPSEESPSSMTPASPSTGSKRIAIVCRDDALGEAVTSYVAQLGLEPVISQQPRADASSLDALEALRQTGFALVLQGDRQLEIGFLLAALGRSRIIVLQPSDGGAQDGLAGLARQAIDEGGLWKLLLAREMKKCGLDVDLNKAL